MFTVMFAMGRLPGWIAQWKEMMGENQPIGRPRQIYNRKKKEIILQSKKDNLKNFSQLISLISR